MQELIKHQEIIKIKPQEVKDLAINFILNCENPASRNYIIYLLKKFIEIVEKNDKLTQQSELAKLYNKAIANNIIPKYNELEIIKRIDFEYEYSDIEKATFLEEQIREFKKALEELKIPKNKKETYYLKEVKNGK